MTARLGCALLGVIALVAPEPALGGRFRVGVTTLTFTKTSESTHAPRPLATVIWYPATPGTGVAEPLGLRDATVRRGRFPLIVFSHGTCGRPTEASYLTMALASRGFVVAAPPHPGNTADDGFAACISGGAAIDALVNRLPDVRFTIDSMLAETANRSSRFARRLRPDAIGVSGLSFGGYTALSAAQQEPRLRAALVLVPGGTALLGPKDIAIPTMVIGAEHDTVVRFAESEKAYGRLAGPRFLVELLGANHLSVVDDCFNHDLGLSFCVAADISQEQAHDLTLHFALPFFRRYLGNAHTSLRPLVRPVKGVRLESEPRQRPAS
jgi:predicted dienelactone hydrolase